MEIKQLVSFDHTRITYLTKGSLGDPCLVLINGLGGSTRIWEWFMDYFAPRLRVITWDLRGLFRSGRPADLNNLTVEDHCKDLELILEAESVEQALVAGWGTGVQVAVEFCRSNQSKARGLVAVAGTPGHHFENILPGVVNRAALLGSWVTMKKAGPLLNRVAGKLSEKQVVPVILRQARLLGDTFEDQFYLDLVGDYAHTDFKALGQTLRLVARYNGWKSLPMVRAPLLVLVGSRDPLMPVSAARKMVQAAKDGELMVVKGGTHYLPVELPELVALRMEKFFREKGGLRDHLLGGAGGGRPRAGQAEGH